MLIMPNFSYILLYLVAAGLRTIQFLFHLAGRNLYYVPASTSVVGILAFSHGPKSVGENPANLSLLSQ
jgi:hypothetical protein